ncbi:N-acetylmuramoyl-L-alanine amidase [Fusobacterium sp.]|uniref:N-acetylmuramoyl-L-alanine amidase n=1 Tax=Fusobacterium sp. TaxID=68766 RepID=UPI00396CDFB1
MKKYSILILLLNFLFISCTSVNYSIDKNSYNSVGKNERIRFIVLHYTATDDKGGLRTLTTERVSAHYFISTKDSEPIYNLVPDEERAWHAGVSDFRDRSNINDSSIGIEITNIGVEDYRNVAKKYGFFVPYDKYVDYSEGQVQKIAHLLKVLVKKYNIDPSNIVGHSDVAPLRKIDPGAKFPWKRLHTEYGIGAWYNERDKEFYKNQEMYDATPVRMIKAEFRKYGYKINDTDEWDEQSRRVVYNFQAHFNPQGLSGNMDLETFAILKALNKKYR